MAEQLDLFPELLPQHPERPAPTFTDTVIGIGVAMNLFGRWCDHVDAEIKRRVSTLDAPLPAPRPGG